MAERTQELSILSRQDPVTALPNRSVILETLGQVRAEQSDVLAFFIALEGLDEIGRLHGYEVMDQTICVLSQHVQQLTELPLMLLGVWSTDKWVALYNRGDNGLSVEQVAQRLVNAIQTPVQMQQWSVHVRARIGVSAVKAERGPEQVVRMAAVAMPTADNQWQAYDQVLEEALRRKNQLSDALYTAVDNHELYVQYQPKVDVVTAQVRGAEALLRWNNPVFGRVSPAEFIQSLKPIV